MYFCGYFVLSNGPNWEVICIIPIFGIVFGPNLGIWPSPGVTIYRDTPTVWPLILKKSHHALSWMYFCGYFSLSNGANWEVICIIPIFGIIFSQKLGIWPPGDTIYQGTLYCLAIHLEEISSCFVLNVFLWLLCITKWSKLGSICIIPLFVVIFGQNFGIWPPGCPYIGLPPTVLQLILKKYHHALSWMYFCGYFALPNGPIWKLFS
jgi:hypothetical protein